MARLVIRGPDLASVIADANACGLKHVVIGGFAVIAHGYIRATKDVDLLVPDDSEADDALLRFIERSGAVRFGDRKAVATEDLTGVNRVRIDSRLGVTDIRRSELSPPLDYGTVARCAVRGFWRGSPFQVASLRSLVGFKRFANRLGDQVDLEALERVHGELPIEPIPSLDD